jgi:hypothetical protein
MKALLLKLDAVDPSALGGARDCDQNPYNMKGRRLSSKIIVDKSKNVLSLSFLVWHVFETSILLPFV